MTTITKILKQFSTYKPLDQLAFLIVLISHLAFAYLIANAALTHPFEGAVALSVFAMYTRGAVMFMWCKITEPVNPGNSGQPAPAQKGA